MLDVTDTDGVKLPLGVRDREGVCEGVMEAVTDRVLEKLVETLADRLGVTLLVIVALGESAGFDNQDGVRKGGDLSASTTCARPGSASTRVRDAPDADGEAAEDGLTAAAAEIKRASTASRIAKF
jgi:hypothetical protein